MGETKVHADIKREIINALQDRKIVYQEEHKIGRVIPDILVDYHFPHLYRERKEICRIALEIQKSPLSFKQMEYRIHKYKEHNMYMLWIVPLNEDIVKYTVYSPMAFEKWLHALYFGRVYYWLNGLNVMPIHYNPYYTNVPLKRLWQPGGTSRVVGGYRKLSKRKRVINQGPVCDIIESFRILKRSTFNSEKFNIPSVPILIDNTQHWW